jgi:hypothetical protein
VRLGSDGAAARSSLGRGAPVAAVPPSTPAVPSLRGPADGSGAGAGGPSPPTVAGHSRHSSAGPLLAGGSVGGASLLETGRSSVQATVHLSPARAVARSLGPALRNATAVPESAVDVTVPASPPPPHLAAAVAAGPAPALPTAFTALPRPLASTGSSFESGAGSSWSAAVASAAVPALTQALADSAGHPHDAARPPTGPSPPGVPTTPVARDAHQPATSRASWQEAAPGAPSAGDLHATAHVARARALMMEQTRAVADQALLFAIKAVAALWRHADVQGSPEAERLWNSAALRGYRLHPAIGLHMGWAIEGAFGSSHKVDPTYFSQHVTLAAKLASLNAAYGSHILMSSAFANRLSPGAAVRLRKIDSLLMVALRAGVGREGTATAAPPAATPPGVTLSLHTWDCVDWRVTVPPALAAALTDRYMRQVIALQRAAKPLLRSASAGGRMARVLANGAGEHGGGGVVMAAAPRDLDAEATAPGGDRQTGAHAPAARFASPAAAAPATPMATFAELAATGTLDADAFVSATGGHARAKVGAGGVGGGWSCMRRRERHPVFTLTPRERRMRAGRRWPPATAPSACWGSAR